MWVACFMQKINIIIENDLIYKSYSILRIGTKVLPSSFERKTHYEIRSMKKSYSIKTQKHSIPCVESVRKNRKKVLLLFMWGDLLALDLYLSEVLLITIV